MLGGPADERAFETFARAAPVPYISLVDRQLHELSAVLAACDLYVGNDSGVSHLAGLSGGPTLALFGPTDPRVWRPLGPRVTVLRRQPLTSLSWRSVIKAADSVIASRPVGPPRP